MSGRTQVKKKKKETDEDLNLYGGRLGLETNRTGRVYKETESGREGRRLPSSERNNQTRRRRLLSHRRRGKKKKCDLESKIDPSMAQGDNAENITIGKQTQEEGK